MRSAQPGKKRRFKEEMCRLFNRKKYRAAWKHKFVCLAYRDQIKIPTTDFEKDELYQARLGEKEIVFESLDINQADFRSIILETYLRLVAGGGFRFLKGICSYN